MAAGDLTALILCGGRGTRALPHTAEIPKPLLDVAGQPVLRHLMEVFVAQGCRSFVLAGGHLVEALREYATALPPAWRVEVVDTGEGTGTAARIAACRSLLGERALVTYGDGLADVDLDALERFHLSHGRAATVTTVPLQSPYGTLDIESNGAVAAFREKPLLREHWINGGFFLFERRAEEHWAGDDLERDVLPALAAAGELYAYRHEGFWRSMDTYKDALELSALATEGRPPWMTSSERASS
jgi:glucose-1-phosphate cytidylyltransferase